MKTQTEEYRVGKRTGQNRWQVKQGRGAWKIVFECDFLSDAAEWLTRRGVDIRLVPVVSNFPWRALGEYAATGELETQPSTFNLQPSTNP